MVTVRPYSEKDKRRVQEVCLRAASAKDSFDSWYSDGSHFILTTYNNYYTEHEPENCFVSVDEDDNAVGYIICAKDVGKWRRVFMKDYFPRLKGMDSKYKLWALAEIIIKVMFQKDYPAHLHIDMSKDYRGQGAGTMMMDALVNHLRENGVKGVQLTCGTDNHRGINFYQKYGFKILNTNSQGVTLGLKLN